MIIDFSGNIPGNEIDKGETLCSYLSPFPADGSGWHRCVFLLYKHQKGPINFSESYGSLPGNRYCDLQITLDQARPTLLWYQTITANEHVGYRTTFLKKIFEETSTLQIET